MKSGNLADILWWGGAGEEQPEEGSVFDIAYSLRASTFRGEKQVSLQFEEFRVVKEPPIELRKRQIEVVDYRMELRQQAGETSGAGSRTPDLGGREPIRTKAGRATSCSLRMSWSSIPRPASSQDLRAALEIVKPAKVYLFAVSPQQEKTDAFLSRLAGLAKFVINQREGKVARAGAGGGHRSAREGDTDRPGVAGSRGTHIDRKPERNGRFSPVEKANRIPISRRSCSSPSGESWRRRLPIAPTLRRRAWSSVRSIGLKEL